MIHNRSISYPIIWMLLAIIAMSCTPSFAQNDNIYHLTYPKEATITTISLASTGTASLLHSRKVPLTAQQVSTLDRGQVFIIDRSATLRYSNASATASDVFLYTSIALPSLLMIDKKIRKDAPTIGLLYLETLAVNFGITALIKEVADRKRPFVFNEDTNIASKTNKDALTSFLSGHTSMSAASTFFMAKVYADYHPNSRWKPLMWTMAATIPAITGTLRYTAGKHYPTDVLSGYLLGAATGILVPHIHKKLSIKTRKETARQTIAY